MVHTASCSCHKPEIVRHAIGATAHPGRRPYYGLAGCVNARALGGIRWWHATSWQHHRSGFGQAGRPTLAAGSGKVSGRPTVHRRTSVSGLRWPGPACTGTGCVSHSRQGSLQCALGLLACDSALWIPGRTQRIACACSTRHDLCTERRACLMALCQAQGCQCEGACGRLARARSDGSVCSGARLRSAKAGARHTGAGLPGSERRPLPLHTLLRAPCRPASRLMHICGTHTPVFTSHLLHGCAKRNSSWQAGFQTREGILRRYEM